MRKLNVLFLCTGNSCRSVMGETILRHIAGDRFDVYSAGTDPKGINPIAEQVLNEIGVSTEGVCSKHVKEYLGKMTFHYVIIVCDDAAESCPRIWPGMMTKLLWPFEDPPKFRGTDDERLGEVPRSPRPDQGSTDRLGRRVRNRWHIRGTINERMMSIPGTSESAHRFN